MEAWISVLVVATAHSPFAAKHQGAAMRKILEENGLLKKE